MRKIMVVFGIMAVGMALLASRPAASGEPREKVLYSFSGPPDGHMPQGGVVKDSAGNLYGTLFYGGAHGAGAVFELSRQPDGSWSETIIYSFHSQNDGIKPVAGLILDAAGNLYGTTEFGGTGPCFTTGCGTVFELSPQSGGTWTEKVLYSFKGTAFEAADGSIPIGALVFDGANNLYGTTEAGGNQNTFCLANPGCGTVFELSPQSGGGWMEKVLYAFTGADDGGVPLARLTLDGSGNLYGTTQVGGSGGGGTVFALVSLGHGSWTEEVLHSFLDGPNDGYAPRGGLTLDAGNLYGTTEIGGNYTGSSCEEIGCGTVFELSPQSGGSWTETVLYAFVGGTDGIAPSAGVIFDASGNIYGTTAVGGTYGCRVAGCGTVFELSPKQTGMWTETILHNFTGVQGDGWRPLSDLIFDSKSNLYGTTQYGGNTRCITEGDGCGTVFKVTP